VDDFEDRRVVALRCKPRRRELNALDPEAKVTSLFEVSGERHTGVTVRWRGKTIGTLLVDTDDLPALRDFLLPGGHT
jgi:hypothetical protein